jgi:hypothetical protein
LPFRLRKSGSRNSIASAWYPNAGDPWSRTSGQDDGYVADGLTEEIINSLMTLSDLLVTRTSAFHFKGDSRKATCPGHRHRPSNGR